MALQLARYGFTDTSALKGGFNAWVQAGLPTEPKEAPANQPHP